MSGKAHAADRPFLAWPAPAELRFSLLLSLVFFVFFELTYIATNYVTGMHRFRVPVHTSAELAIPLVPAMALVYISLNVLLALAPFVLRTWRDITPLAVVMTLETLIAAVFFLLLPVALVYPPAADSSAWGRFCTSVTAISLTYNNLPSLHVAFAFTAALAFGERCGVLGRRLLLLWASSIAVSTVLVHEHHVADVAAGIVLAVAMQRVYRWSAAAPRLDALRLEMLCLGEFRHFVVRHRRYLFTLLAIYKYSLGRWRRTRIVRAGYCLAQHVDDVLDGDRAVDGDPEVYARELLRQISDGSYGDSFVASLAHYVVTELGGAKDDLLRLFDLLLFDYRRRKGRILLNAEELREHHRRTFYYSLNLTLIVCGSELRAVDAPELIASLAWCSVMRDLEEDVSHGLINIPAPMIVQAGKQGASSIEYRQLIRTAAVRHWIRSEYMRGVDAIEQGESRPAPREMRLFLRAIRLYARKYARRNRDILAADTVAPLQEARGDGLC